MDVGKDSEDDENLRVNDTSQELASMPTTRGRQGEHHSQELNNNFAASSSTGGEIVEPPQGDEDEEKEEEEVDGEEVDAWEAVDRETEALILAELRKAEESVYNTAPPSAPATPLEPESSSPIDNNDDNDDNDDDPDAQFWAMHRAQQAEAERKALRKEANFVQEWSSAFVHLRVLGQAVPPPSSLSPPLSNLEKEEEILASHGNGGNVDVLALDRLPSPLACKQRGSGNNNNNNNKPTKDLLLEKTPKKAADPTEVQREELMARLLEGVWQDWLTLLETPLAELLAQEEEDAQQEDGQEGRVNKGDIHTICGEGSCSSVAATTAHKRKLSS